jgi:ribose transport system ATP-binding protein
MAGISKSFPGVDALSDVDFSVRSGEVHGLVGENGAGKSTLIKILMGVYAMDRGAILLDGVPANIHSPIDARALGLNAVFQDVVIAPGLTVGENFFIGRLPTFPGGFIDWQRVYRESEVTLRELGIEVDPRRRIAELPSGEQAMVTIAKIVREKARLVIFDEPTARLTTEEKARLFELIGTLKKQNMGIIYISHHLEEIFEICDTVTVLRDGRVAGRLATADVNEDALISLMVGRSIEQLYDIHRGAPGEVLLEVTGLTREPYFRDVSFTLRRGEVLGLFGLVGARRTEMLRAVFGVDRCTSGEIRVLGKRVVFHGPYGAMEAGLAFVPEERKLQGLAMPLSVKTNLNIASYGAISSLGFVDIRKETERARQQVDSLAIRTPSLDQVVDNLSGGNQQKVAIGKWLCRDADILILDEPTTGVDVGAKVEIYHLIETLLARGKAVIVCSSYLPEVIGLSDRIIVMAEGETTGEVVARDATEEGLLRLASKLHHASSNRV